MAEGRDGHRPPDGMALLSTEQHRGLAERWPGLQPTDAMARQVAEAALRDAGRSTEGLALILGTSNGGLHARQHYRDACDQPGSIRGPLLQKSTPAWAARNLGITLGCDGPCVTVSTACASSTHAAGLAIAWLRRGLIRAALVVGVDVVLPMVAEGFRALGVLGAGPCAPFSRPVGMSLGEGAVAWVLEREEEARARSASTRGYLLGWGSSADAFHPTAPDPRGLGMARSVSAALDDAGVSPDEVDLYSAQGTGTEANDAAETLAILSVFGERIPVTAGKGHLGHCQGSGGLLEASLVLAAMANQALPPVARFSGARALSPPGLLHGPVEESRLDVVVKHSAAFGGANASLVLGRHARRSRMAPGGQLPVGIAASAVILPEAPGAALAYPDRVGRTRVSNLDPLSRYLTVVSGRVLPPTGGDGGGLVAAVPGLSGSVGDSWQQSVERGAASGRSFSRLVRNAAAGAAAQAHGLTGPTLTLASGPGSGLLAFAAAAGRVSPPGVVVAAADEVGDAARELHSLGPEPHTPLTDAAAALWLVPGGKIAVEGIGLAGPWGLVQAIRACGGGCPDAVYSGTGARLDPRHQLDSALVELGMGDLPSWDVTDEVGHAEASGSLIALIRAEEQVRRGRLDRVLVVAIGPGAFTVAVLIARGEG